ncbi:PTS N,N'-diacetylchitobiose transporter subunit IIC [Salmonella enterica]|uniref:Permease IIC component n=3 Tax=Salmonella enterica TaxID=28901 RepID=A0A742R9K4_SALER|nr:PTS N,N'-diacetylchitobiose transporter subunit IIC [Salmonella enterica subsp. enterica serovar Koketime]EAB8207800.1 PTS N,N'-diacetylchitobiose transporter subunit IIC [Salmonella enterica subsp. enterica serovar Lattenkamp]EAM8932144.1 PTS N,N'-diacetylchitobiose transporter subunit IIC [Salmonella enterica]ECJ3923649.1 PTS N,N'-diacetylchitobiose transporter subunit IIC [Salmonella enterica subsp. enterica]EHG3456898.1 PTS N,N'-diacetylchitobiose transporter subunit IIC [Salmonella ente
MSKAIDSLERVLLPFAVKLGKQVHVNAIKNGFIRLMPLTLAGAMFVLINNVFLSFGEGSFFFSLGVRLDASTIQTLEAFKIIGSSVYNGTLGIMSLMTPFFIGMALAEERKVDPLAAGLLSVASFMTVTPFTVGEAYAVGANWLGGQNIISGIIIGLVVAEIFTFIVRRDWVIKLPDSVPASVSRSFSALIPGFIILLIMGFVAWGLSLIGSNFHQLIMDSVSKPLASMGSVVGWAYVIFNALLWFFGVHGGLALTALNSGILAPWGMENMATYTQFGSVDAAIAAGKSFHFWTGPMLESYIFLGGTGATLGLIIAIFIASQRADHRQVAKLALPSGLFNINEPILFGMPIIMNPLMMIPFVLIQPILTGITLAAYSLGIIPPSTNFAPWTMPPGLGAFFNSNGSIGALILALFNLGVATLFYLPFVIISNKAQTVIEEEESEEDIKNALSF